jgi:hypothetical protein
MVQDGRAGSAFFRATPGNKAACSNPTHEAQRRGGGVPRPLQRLVRRHWSAHLMICCYSLPASAMMRRSMGVKGGTSSMTVFHNTARLTCM